VPGNLYVVVHVAPHPQLRRQETELFYELPLSITQAALGARVTVPTATGSEEIEIKATDSDTPAGGEAAAGAPKRRKSGRRRGRQPGIRDRLRDAIS